MQNVSFGIIIFDGLITIVIGHCSKNSPWQKNNERCIFDPLIGDATYQ